MTYDTKQYVHAISQLHPHMDPHTHPHTHPPACQTAVMLFSFMDVVGCFMAMSAKEAFDDIAFEVCGPRFYTALTLGDTIILLLVSKWIVVDSGLADFRSIIALDLPIVSRGIAKSTTTRRTATPQA